MPRRSRCCATRRLKRSPPVEERLRDWAKANGCDAAPPKQAERREWRNAEAVLHTATRLEYRGWKEPVVLWKRF